MTWRDAAACRGMDTDVFFPLRGEDVRAAKAVCADCPVSAECLDEALAEREVIGVWGGTSERERRRIRRIRARLRAGVTSPDRGGALPGDVKPISHGTDAGYRAHVRRGEEACPECSAAHAAYQRERSARRAS